MQHADGYFAIGHAPVIVAHGAINCTLKLVVDTTSKVPVLAVQQAINETEIRAILDIWHS